MARAKSPFPVKPTILIDTREKPANRLFNVNLAGDDQVAAYIEQKVDAGDYTVLEMPDLVISLSQNEDIHFLFTGQKHAPRAAKKILIKTYEWERKRLMKKAKELDDAD